jgi:catechol 2,3-dioxygenase-like lactoylglutathione lyase family enzyme
MQENSEMEKLDEMHHVAIPVCNVAATVEWYKENFKCRVLYQDETWAFLKLKNIHLAFVIPKEHPPHIAFLTDEPEKHGDMKEHRDGTRSKYISDAAGNSVEIVDRGSLGYYEKLDSESD